MLWFGGQYIGDKIIRILLIFILMLVAEFLVPETNK